LSKNSQIDFNVGGSLKDTPTYSYFDLGFSQRIDWHKDISPIDKERFKQFRIDLKQKRKEEKVNKKSSKKLNKTNKKQSKAERKNLKKSQKVNRKKFLIF
jgi:hypothetical protein